VDASPWLVDRPGGANSSGVDFCLSQLAQFPESSVGTSSAGEAIRELAASGPGAVPDTLEGARYPPVAVLRLGTRPDRLAEGQAPASPPANAHGFAHETC
jgi:hypothetical protein